MSIENVLNNLDAADKDADAATEKLKEQNARLNVMGQHLNTVDQTLEETEKQVQSLETKYGLAGMMGQAAKDALVGGDVKSQMNQIGKRKNEATEIPRKEGWLLKRGKKFGAPWTKVFMRLFGDAVVMYKGADVSELVKVVPVMAPVKCYPFSKMKAPGESPKHRGEKPNGFCIFAPGTSEPYTYIETASKDELVEWTVAIRKRIKKLDPSRKKGAANGEDSNVKLINEKLKGLQGKADNMMDLADEQGELIQVVQEQVDHATERMKDQNERMVHHIEND